jgi:hypothetical protein
MNEHRLVPTPLYSTSFHFHLSFAEPATTPSVAAECSFGLPPAAPAPIKNITTFDRDDNVSLCQELPHDRCFRRWVTALLSIAPFLSPLVSGPRVLLCGELHSLSSGCHTHIRSPLPRRHSIARPRKRSTAIGPLRTPCDASPLVFPRKIHRANGLNRSRRSFRTFFFFRASLSPRHRVLSQMKLAAHMRSKRFC